jgi:tRNA U34 5-methylaminomethyl-2-thiouridine-forming methyltransferase MnmC
MALKIIETADGSTSFYNDELDETYHSRHGAIQEAKHVFLKMGLAPMLEKYSKLDILEIGFGTGLNAWLTSMAVLEEAGERMTNEKSIEYVGVEAYPIGKEELLLLNYDQFSSKDEEKALFKKIHSVVWESSQVIHDHFKLKKRKQDFNDIEDVNSFDLIYFDAFGPRVQPDLWSAAIFEKMFKALKEKGMLVTYSCKGDVRRAMLEVGFKVEKVPGPPGKREMLVAKKGEL